LRGQYEQLDGEQRALILHSLAEYEGPTDISRKFEGQYGRKISEGLIRYYRDTDSWASEIATIRQELNRRIIADIPIASKRWRLKQLYRHWKAAADEGRHMSAARMLRQAAEELGQIRVGIDLDVGEREHVVSVAGTVIPSAIAGLPEPGTVLDGEG